MGVGSGLYIHDVVVKRSRSLSHLLMSSFHPVTVNFWVEGAGLVAWAGGPPGASFEFYLREAFQSHTHTEKILYTKSH